MGYEGGGGGVGAGVAADALATAVLFFSLFSSELPPFAAAAAAPAPAGLRAVLEDDEAVEAGDIFSERLVLPYAATFWQTLLLPSVLRSSSSLSLFDKPNFYGIQDVRTADEEAGRLQGWGSFLHCYCRTDAPLNQQNE